MKKYGKLAIIVVALVIIMIGTGFFYNNLTMEYKAGNEVIVERTKTEAEGEVEEATEAEVAVDEAAMEEETETTADAHDPERQAALDFTVFNTEGEEVTLSSFYGKPLVVNFWASWCPPCKREFPDFQEAYETHGEEVEFLMVNMTDGSRETEEKAKAFIEKNGYTVPLYLDTAQDAATTYQVYSLPTTFFIDADGNIAAYAQGMIDEDGLARGLEMILE